MCRPSSGVLHKVRELVSELGVDVEPAGSAVIDHFSHDTADASHTAVLGSGFMDSKAVFGGRTPVSWLLLRASLPQQAARLLDSRTQCCCQIPCRPSPRADMVECCHTGASTLQGYRPVGAAREHPGEEPLLSAAAASLPQSCQECQKQLTCAAWTYQDRRQQSHDNGLANCCSQTFPALWASGTAYSGNLGAPVRENPNLAGAQVGTAAQ